MPMFIHLVEDVDSSAFVTSEEMGQTRRGYMRK